jgi:hypothetical protein
MNGGREGKEGMREEEEGRMRGEKQEEMSHSAAVSILAMPSRLSLSNPNQIQKNRRDIRRATTPKWIHKTQ